SLPVPLVYHRRVGEDNPPVQTHLIERLNPERTDTLGTRHPALVTARAAPLPATPGAPTLGRDVRPPPRIPPDMDPAQGLNADHGSASHYADLRSAYLACASRPATPRRSPPTTEPAAPSRPRPPTPRATSRPWRG